MPLPCDALFLHAFHDAIGQAHQALQFTGNDDLGRLTVGHHLHGFDGLQLDVLVSKGSDD